MFRIIKNESLPYFGQLYSPYYFVQPYSPLCTPTYWARCIIILKSSISLNYKIINYNKIILFNVIEIYLIGAHI